MIYLMDGALYQWDTGRRLELKPKEGCIVQEVHYHNGTTENAFVVKVKSTTDGMVYAEIPNVLLQTANYIRAYAYFQNDDLSMTMSSLTIKVNAREKPADYVYSETELFEYETVLAEVRKVNEHIDAATAAYLVAHKDEFKGDKGDKGDPGAIKTIPVNELPAVGTDDAIYLVPNPDSQEQNRYLAYIWVNGAWERMEGAEIGVDLTDYVKNTDYVAPGKRGLVNIDIGYGIGVVTNGCLRTHRATPAEIKAKKDPYKPLVPLYIDDAIKVGITTNTIPLTAEEQTAAQSWLGVGAPLVINHDYATSVVISPNNLTEIATLTGDITITLANVDDNRDNEWAFSITQGNTVYVVNLPDVQWQFGIAPSFAGNTTTEVRLYYRGGVLKGVWDI